MEILYDKVFTMKKGDEHFSNRYYEVEIVRDESLTAIRFVGRFSSLDDMEQYIPGDWKYEGCEYEKGKIKFKFTSGDKPIELSYKLTNRKNDL